MGEIATTTPSSWHYLPLKTHYLPTPSFLLQSTTPINNMDLPSPSSSTNFITSRKRLKLSTLLPKSHNHPQPSPNNKWRSPAQERLYRDRLLDALRSTTTNSTARNSRDTHAIKAAADSALALTARGSTRWSRAILSRRLKIRKMALRAAGKLRRKRPTKFSQPEKKVEGKVGERLRRLSRLVPGCRRASTGSLLEETADYVAALEVQVKAMRALADALAAAAISTRVEDAGS